MPVVEYEVVSRGGATYAAVTMASEANRNALSSALLAELQAAFERAASDNVRAVLLRANGPAFCAGADLKEALKGGMDVSMRRLVELMRTIATLPFPVVARIHGPVRAGGVGIVAACDVAVAADHVTYAFTEARLGLAPAAISLTVLPRMQQRAAALSFLSAGAFDGLFAMDSGLVSLIVPARELDEAIESILDDIVHGEPQGLAATKQVLNADLINYIDARTEGMLELSVDLFASDVARGHLSAFARA